MTELQLQLNLCDYLRLQWPGVIFRSDVGSGNIKLTQLQAARNKRLQSGRGFPDLFIFQPRGDLSGLAIELKKPGTKIYKADGTIYADQHLREQADMLQALRDRGYAAYFATTF